MDPDTYFFTDRPWRSAGAVSTDFFFSYLFNYKFNDTPPNAVLTFNVYSNDSDMRFEGPMISIFLKASQMIMEADNSTLLYKYDIQQSPEQKAIMPLDDFFGNNEDNVDESYTFGQCSFFIDPDSDGIPSIISVESISDISRRDSLFATAIDKSIAAISCD